MKLIKLFRSSDTGLMQQQIDTWIEFSGKDITIERYDTSVTSASAGSMIGLTIIVAITYTKGS